MGEDVGDVVLVEDVAVGGGFEATFLDSKLPPLPEETEAVCESKTDGRLIGKQCSSDNPAEIWIDAVVVESGKCFDVLVFDAVLDDPVGDVDELAAFVAVVDAYSSGAGGVVCCGAEEGHCVWVGYVCECVGEGGPVWM